MVGIGLSFVGDPYIPGTLEGIGDGILWKLATDGVLPLFVIVLKMVMIDHPMPKPVCAMFIVQAIGLPYGLIKTGSQTGKHGEEGFLT